MTPPPKRPYYYYTEKELLTELPKGIKSLLYRGPCCFVSDRDWIENYDYAIVCGWDYSPDDPDPSDSYYRNGQRIAIKLARQPLNHAYWCDYNVDWSYPPLDDQGNVWDTNLFLYSDSNLKEVIHDLFKTWDKMWLFYRENNI